MDVLLVAPSNHRKNRLGDSIRRPLVLYPKYNLLLLASLVPENVKVSIVDEAVEEINFNGSYDLVGITVLTSNANHAYAIADQFRFLGVTVVLGGIHVSYNAYEALQHADSVVTGEGEFSWPELIADFQDGNLKQIYASSERHDLSNFPTLRRDLVKRAKYRRPDVVETSRGCPHSCEFCGTKFFGPRYRSRLVEDVVNEIKSIREKYSDYVVFIDDNIFGIPNRTKRLFEALLDLDIRWTSHCTLNIADNLELVKLAAKSGCQNLIVGFDSLSKTNIKKINKGFNKVDKYEESIRILHDHGIRVVSNFIFGFDDDDESVFENTVRFIERNKIFLTSFWILTPYPGTALHNRIAKENRIINNNWDNYDSRHVVFKPKMMSPETLYEGFDNANKTVFSWWSIAKRVVNTQKAFTRRLGMNIYMKNMYSKTKSYYIE